MKKSFAFSILSTCILFGISPVKADWTHWGLTQARGTHTPNKLYKFNRDTGKRTLITEECIIVEVQDVPDGECESWDPLLFDEDLGRLVITREDGKYYSYNEVKDEWELIDESWKEDYDTAIKLSLIKRDNDSGVTSIGLNSLNFKETDKKLDLWGTNLDGEKVPVNVTSGLLIKGRDVEQSINNVGAMSAALTGLPTVPTDTKISCGLGTGTHGGDFAFSGGCASKVNEKLSINYAASMSMPGQEYAGDFVDQFSARAGFVWQLGESNKPTQISLKVQKELEEKIKTLETKNDKVISQNEKLLARLEKLENIAFKLQKNDGLKLSKGILE